jgi:DNA repair exonuclease SbcCD ATPase subunit
MQKKVVNIDLSSINELQKYLETLSKLYDKSSNNRSQILKLRPKITALIKEIEDYDREAESIYKKAQQAFKEYENKAKDLGLNVKGSKGEIIMKAINGASIMPTKREVIGLLNFK